MPLEKSNKEPEKPERSWTVTEPKYEMQDLILAPETVKELESVVSYFKNKDKLFKDWGLSKKYKDMDGLAVNLYGEPGTGKTMAAHAIAKALDLKMICVDYAEIESKYVGETSKNLASMFKSAVKQNAMIFFDEADALLSRRVTNMTLAADVSVNQTRSVLLTLLNDYQGVIVFATNFIQNFDAAFLRRIRYHILFNLPDVQEREKLWRLYIPQEMPVNVDYTELAGKIEGISGSDISNAVFYAALDAAREGAAVVEQDRFEHAIQSYINAKRKNQGITSVTETKRILTDEEAKAAGLPD